MQGIFLVTKKNKKCGAVFAPHKMFDERDKFLGRILLLHSYPSKCRYPTMF